MRPNSNSLFFRLTASAAVVSLVLLIAAGFLLSYLFQDAVERNFDARLEAVLNSLLSNVELNQLNTPIVGEIADARFKLPLSGWYWQITPLDDGPGQALASNSLLEQRLKPEGLEWLDRDKAGVARFYMKDSNGANLRVMEQPYTLFGSKGRFSFIVAGNFDELKNEVSAFRNTLFLVLGLLGVGLLVALLVQVRFGLRPLRELQSELTAVRQGREASLKGEYPTEIQPVSHELNLLIQSNSEIVERARTQVGNLAHALKTPLSVLTNEAGIHGGKLSSKVKEQTNVMRDQVNMYLDRARRAARAQTLGAVTDPKDVIDAIARTLQRIHIDRGIDVKVNCPKGLKFRGERQDLEEMVGNLLDNAFKYAREEIHVTVSPVAPDEKGGRMWLNIKVGDDGPGLPDDGSRDAALRRGQRLDETKPGSGLGLAIVTETAAMYNGDLSLDEAELGGLLTILKLPAAQA